MKHNPDRLFATPHAQVADFAFNEDVVRVFPDMIKRSVPGYPTIVENIGVLAAQFAQPHSVLYDLGSSLGAVTQALRRHVTCSDCKVIAVDNSSAMVERCIAAVTRGLVERGVRQLIVAGGETSGACVQALGIAQMQIGPQIDPGVPWCHAVTASGVIHLTLKSGNFGTDDFFSKAFTVLA